jgi:predicted DNA-binding protein
MHQQKRMAKKYSNNIITVESQNLSLVIEDELYARLPKLARFTETEVSNYVEEIIKNVTLPE